MNNERSAPSGESAGESAQADVTPPRRSSAASRARRIGGRVGAASTTAPQERGKSVEPSAAVGSDDDDAAGSKAAEPAAELTAEPGAPAAQAPQNAPAWLVWAPGGILVAGVIAMAAVIAVVSHGVWWGERYDAPSRTNPLREQVSAAAKTCLARTNSYDYRDLGAFEKAGLACTTGQEASQFRDAVDNIIKVNAVKLKATQNARINTTGIESVSGDQWTLLVYGQLKVTNSSTPKGRLDPFAAEVRMEKARGKWLIAAEKVVSQPVS